MAEKHIKAEDSPGSSSRGTSLPEGASTSQNKSESVKMAEKDIKVEDSPGGSSRANPEPEGAAVSQDPHGHQFKVKFSKDDPTEYTLFCDQPRTVLQAIKTLNQYCKKVKDKHENIIIQMGTGDNKSSISMHFPCSCIGHDAVLTISCKKQKVEEDQHDMKIYTKDKYSVFYIEKEGGKDTKTKPLFLKSYVKQFRYLRVCGEKGITVEQALQRDGRFIDLGYFELSDNDNPNAMTECTQRVDNLENKKFKICLSEKAPDSPHASEHILAVVQQKGISVKTEVKKTESGDNTDEICEQLHEKFPDLKKWMESRFPGDSYQEAWTLRKENFGKIHQSFSEVHIVRKLLELGKSVCKICVKDICVGTGFVLFDNLILTNAHLFTGYVEGKKLQQDIEVFAIFNYEGSGPETKCYYFTAENTFIDFDAELDYAVLELKPEGSQPNKSVPTGLLSKFGPLPPNGEACIIGHPAGGVKKIDPTFIIEAEKRGQAIDEHLRQYKDTLFTIQSINELMRKQKIENILKGGCKAEKVGTYHTFMYHGASGSPVFDGLGRVFGLHTAGFTYGFLKDEQSVIEYAHPLMTIFEKFVSNLKTSGNEELLKTVEEAAQGNDFLIKVLKREQEDAQPMDVSESE